MTRTYRRRTIAPLVAMALACMAALAAPVPALAMQILEAADHAELAAEISATGVNRIALAGDRIAKVVRAPDGYAVEHDAASGDLYLRPLSHGCRRRTARSRHPLRRHRAGLHLPADADPGGPGLGADPDPQCRRPAGDRRRARRDCRGGRDRRPCGRAGASGARRGPARGAARLRDCARRGRSGKPHRRHPELFIETWRGPRLTALVFEAARPASAGGDEAADLAGTIGSLPGVGGARLAALWLAAPGTGPGGGRLVVAVTEAVAAGEPR